MAPLAATIRRLSSLVLALFLSFSLVACGAKGPDVNQASANPTAMPTGQPVARPMGMPTEKFANKPNILFIMGDDIGWMQPSIYHRGLMVGETPNIDRIGKEGAIFMDYVAMQSCTSGRNAFFTGMYPLRTGMIPPQLPGSPSLSQARHSRTGQVPARSGLHHGRIRQESPG